MPDEVASELAELVRLETSAENIANAKLFLMTKGTVNNTFLLIESLLNVHKAEAYRALCDWFEADLNCLYVDNLLLHCLQSAPSEFVETCWSWVLNSENHARLASFIQAILILTSDLTIYQRVWNWLESNKNHTLFGNILSELMSSGEKTKFPFEGELRATANNWLRLNLQNVAAPAVIRCLIGTSR